MQDTTRDKQDFTSLDRRLTLASLLGPLAALSNLGMTYSLAPSACVDGSKAVMHVSAGAFLIVSLAAALLGWRHHRDAVAGIIAEERVRWMARLAVALSLLSALAIVAMEIPNIMLRNCD